MIEDYKIIKDLVKQKLKQIENHNIIAIVHNLF